MARMPAARWLDEHSPRRPMARHDIVCVHTIVGWAPAHAAHFSVKLDGTILQSRDTAYQSAANLDGNPRVLAIENEDGGRWWEPLTPEQVESNAQILAWAHRTHGVPMQMCPDSRPTSRGLAYHRQGIDGNFGGYRFAGRVRGGETWTNHYGKVCPGDAKIAQLPEILERAKALVNGEEDDMPYRDWPKADQKALAKDVAHEVWTYRVRDADGEVRWTRRLIKQAANSLRLSAENRRLIREQIAAEDAEGN